MTQDDLTQPMPHNSSDIQQDNDATIASSYASQTLPYAQETTSPPPPAPYYAQPETPVQPTAPGAAEATQPQGNPYYPQAPATLAQATGNANYAAATPPAPPQPTPPRNKWTRKKLLLVGGAIILVLFLLGIAGAWLIPTLQSKTNSQASSSPTAVARKPVARAGIYAPYLARYGATIRTQIAQGLHLTPAQLATQLRSGKTLSAVATAQGVSASQLQTLVTSAFQNGLQPAITNGNLTQQQVNVLIKRMLRQPQVLDRFLEVTPKVKATPAANQ